jgi:uncharacterized membrane protein
MTHIDRLKAPTWLRCAMILALVAILLANLIIGTFGLLSQPNPRRYIVLGIVWVIGIVGLVLLARLWRTMVPRRMSPPSAPPA